MEGGRFLEYTRPSGEVVRIEWEPRGKRDWLMSIWIDHEKSWSSGTRTKDDPAEWARAWKAEDDRIAAALERGRDET